MDTPEHIWRLLESKRCLDAAWLYLICKLVYRSLLSAEEIDEKIVNSVDIQVGCNSIMSIECEV
jgi:hypothetical protein